MKHYLTSAAAFIGLVCVLAAWPQPLDRPPRPGGPGGPPPWRDRPKVDLSDLPKAFVKNPRFTETDDDGKSPTNYTLKGTAQWVSAGRTNEITDRGIALLSGKQIDGKSWGTVSQDVTGFEGGTDKWFRFSIRGLPEPGFAVKDDELFLRVEFFGKKGTDPLDGVTRKIYSLVQRDRKELADNGNRHRNGDAVWKTYPLDFKLPFKEVDMLRLSVGFKNGSALPSPLGGEGKGEGSAFYVTEFSLVPIPAPDDAPKVVKKEKGYEPSLKNLMPLGGRWYYDPEPGVKEKPIMITAKNASRLYYKDDRLTNPFAENMTAWLRKGYLDIDGKLVEEDRFVPDNLVLEFKDDKVMIVHARNIPNHPTAQFPERFGNPSYIQEHDYTYYIPLNPEPNPKAIAMDKNNSNRALPMGAIGIAINGVVFYNPFDAGMQDATDMMDRCCGHPSPDNRYHYHKYPVCVKSPFADEGEDHSPLIGFAFDGFPIYGPYSAKGVLAKDDKDNSLNEFNIHKDDIRGWHYQVTPGKFPYVLGGYYGEADTRNFPRRGPPPGR